MQPVPSYQTAVRDGFVRRTKRTKEDNVNIRERLLPGRAPRCKGGGRLREERSPTFVATFADGKVTRMTTFQKTKALDLGRGVRLARAAYESRMKKAPPSIVEAHYERDGEVLESYEREQLDTVP
jgi:hypothetical protein